MNLPWQFRIELTGGTAFAIASPAAAILKHDLNLLWFLVPATYGLFFAYLIYHRHKGGNIP